MPTSIFGEAALSVRQVDFKDIRTWIGGACLIQLLISSCIAPLGFTQLYRCNEYRYGGWSMVYGGFFIGWSFATGLATYQRKRLAVLLFQLVNSIVCCIALGIEGWSYFCVDLHGGANRETRNCPRHIEAFNSCQWMEKWISGTAHFLHEHEALRKTLLILIVLNLVCGVSMLTMCLTEAGRNDLCEFEDALRHLKETNEQLDYRRKARRNRILTRYVSQARSHEGQSYPVKMMQFLGLANNEVIPVPVENRKVKLIAPPPKQRKSIK